jgi:putative FmdB family regulatory protein
MPLYDYDCAACGTRFEVIHGVHADPPASCPVCGKGPLKKAFAAPAVHFKGSGWAKKERRPKVSSSTSSSDGAESGSKESTGSDGGTSTTGDASRDGAATPKPAPATPAASGSSAD